MEYLLARYSVSRPTQWHLRQNIFWMNAMLVLLHPTRLLQRKNVEFGMAVLAELRGHARNAVLLITAAADPHNAISTEYGKALRARRIDLGLEDSAVFVSDDFTPDKDDLSSLYSLADALLFPSTQEGFGLPVLEAALHRLPIFCADVEPMNLLLQHSIHAFDPYGSPCDVAKLIERILDQSAPHRARREVLRRYTWERVWEEHLAPLLEGSRIIRENRIPASKVHTWRRGV
jgi:glycosyltransferase involved in cell wall biosynthesis